MTTVGPMFQAFGENSSTPSVQEEAGVPLCPLAIGSGPLQHYLVVSHLPLLPMNSKGGPAGSFLANMLGG